MRKAPAEKPLSPPSCLNPEANRAVSENHPESSHPYLTKTDHMLLSGEVVLLRPKERDHYYTHSDAMEYYIYHYFNITINNLPREIT